MRIGLVDVDALNRGKVTFPNLSLMKLSAYHRGQGDIVEWYNAFAGQYDKVYCSKVFGDEYSGSTPAIANADEVIYGGSGYAITVKDGLEVYDKTQDRELPYRIEHAHPDYTLYPQFPDTAYGFLTRGCPRQCKFCHVAKMQGITAHKVADLQEFWNGQKRIVLLDPNLLACSEWRGLLKQLAGSGAAVDWSQGLDFRLMTEEKAKALADIRHKMIHFAWDNPQDDLSEKIDLYGKYNSIGRSKLSCYVLTNFNSTFEDDVRRVETLKGKNIQPYVMIYRKGTAPKRLLDLQRYANNPTLCWALNAFEDYAKTLK